MYSLFYDLFSVEAVGKYVKVCVITLSKFINGPGDLDQTVVECVYNKYEFLDICVFTKYFEKMSSCHSFM